MALPREYQDVSIYMTQVLETMIERQRLEMHQKLNEMFKTYFDAKEMEITKAASEPDKNDEDDELYRYSFMLLFFFVDSNSKKKIAVLSIILFLHLIFEVLHTVKVFFAERLSITPIVVNPVEKV